MNKLLSLVLSLTMLLTSVLPSYAQALTQNSRGAQGEYYANNQSTFPFYRNYANWQNTTYLSILEKTKQSETYIFPLLELTKENDENSTPEPLINFVEFKTEYLKKLNEQEREYIKKAKSAEEVRLIKDFFAQAAEDNTTIQKSYQEAETNLKKDIEDNPEIYHRLAFESLQPRVEMAISLLGKSPVAEKVMPYLAAYNFLSDNQKKRVASIYRQRVIANHSYCENLSWWSGVKGLVGADGDIQEAQKRCTKAIEAASNLALVGANFGESREDSYALRDLLLSGYKGIAAPTVIQVTSQGLLALEAEQLLSSAILGIIRTPAVSSFEISLGMISLETWIQAFQEIGNYDDAFGSAVFAEGLEYSFYDNPDPAYDNKNNMWFNLAKAWTELANDPNEERRSSIKSHLDLVMRDIVSYNSKGISVKFRPFVVGALLGGYEVDFPQPVQHYEMDSQGNGHLIEPDTEAWKSITGHIKSTGFSNSQYIAWFLYNTKKIDLDPATTQFMNNMLTNAFIKLGEKRGYSYQAEKTNQVTTYTVATYVKTGQPVTMENGRHPPAELYDTHKYRQDWKKTGRIVDVALAVVGLLFIAKGVAGITKLTIDGIKNATRVLKLARAGQMATGSTYRASVSRVLSHVRAINGTLSYRSAMYESIGNSIGLSRMKLDVPIKEIRTVKSTAGAPKVKPTKINVLELNGDLYVVPEGMETFYVNGEVVYVKKGTSLSSVAKQYGIEKNLVRRAKNGTSWTPATSSQTTKFYGTGEAVEGSVGSQPVYNLQLTRDPLSTSIVSTQPQLLPDWTPKPIKKFEITPWKWYEANFQVGVETFASNLAAAFRSGIRNPFQATGMALSSYGLGGVMPVSLMPQTAQVVTAAAPITRTTLGLVSEIGSFASTTPLKATSTGMNALANSTGRLWLNPFWGLFPVATSSHITPVGAISNITTSNRRENSRWASFTAFQDYNTQLNNWLYTSSTVARSQNPFFLYDKWTDFSTTVSLDWQAINLRRNNNPFFREYNQGLSATPFTSFLPSFLVNQISLEKNYTKHYFKTQRANRKARAILARKVPLLTDLRAILQSTADEQYKKQALLRLYTETNLFKEVLTRKDLRALKRAEATDELADFLFNLFELGTFNQVLENLNNNIPTNVLANQLAEIIASPDFEATRRAVYDNTPVLSEASNNFTGVVESLQNVDVEMLLAAARTENWAARSAADGQEVAGGWIYYENDIPVYYRNSSGKLSNSPVIILHQEAGTFYSSLLARLHLSTPKGIKIPKGMVLALDENGKFKYVFKPGHRDEVEDSKAAKEIMAKIYKGGSVPVEIDTPYSTTDLLAIAQILEKDLHYNFDLTLNAPNSFKLFVNGIGALSGLGVDNVMVGPFKNAAGPENPVVPNAFGGVGYVTPRVAGEMTPLMKEWGMPRSTTLILSTILLTLGISMFFGINGLVPIGDIVNSYGLGALAAPMVVLILTASLLRSSIPLLLNHYKDPKRRITANLQVSTYQQGAKVGMALLAGIWTGAGGKFVSVPLAAILTAGTLGLFLNTPMGKAVLAEFTNALKHPSQIFKAIKTGVVPVVKSLTKGLFLGVTSPFIDAKNYLSKTFNKIRNTAKNQTPVEEPAPIVTDEQSKEKAMAAQFQNEYERDFLTDPDTKNSILRVTVAYASYAASIMLLNQVAEGPLEEWIFNTYDITGIGKYITTAFAAAAFAVRYFATRFVSSGRFTDDQLTGISFVGLATMPLILAFLPYEGVGGLVGILLAGIFLNMSTAVPGQLDQTRLQNNVSAKILAQKNTVIADPTLTPEQKEEKLKELEKKESHWSAQASKSYSTANAKGIYGIYAAILASILLPHFGFEWGMIARAVFLYAGAAAAIGAFKTLDMAGSFIKALTNNKKLVITKEDIDNNAVTPQTFGIKDANKARQMIPALTKGKESSIKTLREELVPHGVVAISSEVKLARILKRMIEIHNRLVAASTLLGYEAVESSFQELKSLTEDFQKVLKKSNASILLNREYINNFLPALCVDGDLRKGLLATPTYMAEGTFDIPAEYRKLLEARDLILEMNVLGRNIQSGGAAIKPDTYRNFIKYHNEAVQMLLDYAETNPSEIPIIKLEQNKIARLCRKLQKSNAVTDNGRAVPQKDVQDLKDLLNLYD